MKYLCLIYEDESLWATRSEAVNKAIFDAYFAYTGELKAAGALVAGEALRPVSTATTVRVRGGAASMTDGPFAETKEQLGGFYLIDVPTLDEALAWAAKIPASSTGSIEVRPLMEFDPESA